MRSFTASGDKLYDVFGELEEFLSRVSSLGMSMSRFSEVMNMSDDNQHNAAVKTEIDTLEKKNIPFIIAHSSRHGLPLTIFLTYPPPHTKITVTAGEYYDFVSIAIDIYDQ